MNDISIFLTLSNVAWIGYLITVNRKINIAASFLLGAFLKQRKERDVKEI